MNRPRASASLDVLAKSARRRRRQRRTLPISEHSLVAKRACEKQVMTPKSVARLLGPSVSGRTLRLVLLGGSSRKSMLANASLRKVAAVLTNQDSCTGRPCRACLSRVSPGLLSTSPQQADR